MRNQYQFVIVGSGINSLVCAALLSKAGKQVVVLERNERIGGCIRAEQLFPGYTHDLLASSFPLFMAGPGYQALGSDLHAAGLEFANTDLPTALLTDDGRSLIMSTDREQTRQRFDAVHAGDGAAFGAAIEGFFEANADLTFGLLGNELYSRAAAKILLREVRRRKLRGTLTFFGEALESCRTWVEREFKHELVKGLIAPWVLHAGLGPDDAYSGLMGRVIMGATGMAGMPVVVGGGHRILEAFRSVVEQNGGTLVTGADVARVEVAGGHPGPGLSGTSGFMVASHFL